MISISQFLKVLALSMAVAGCDQHVSASDMPAPQEVSDAAIGHFCGMALTEHPGPKGQIFVAGSKEPVWFASVRETFAFMMLPEEPKNVVAIYVTDMGKATNWQMPEPGTWIDAKKAHYVIGSRRLGGMGADEAIPFGTKDQADRFVQENGGRIVAFADMPEDFILQYSEADPVDQSGNPEPRAVRVP